MHVPINALPGQDSDAAINLYDSTQSRAFTGSNACVLNNGVNASGGISCGIGNIWNILGDGVTQSANFTNCTKNYVCDIRTAFFGTITASHDSRWAPSTT